MISMKFDVIKYRNFAFLLSGFFIIITPIILAVKGIKKGVEFSGGTLIEISLEKNIDLELFSNKVKASLTSININTDASYQQISDNKFLIRLSSIHQESSDNENSASKIGKIKESMTAEFGNIDNQIKFDRIEDIGPQISKETGLQSMIAVSFAFIAIMIYMAIRFSWQFALCGTLVLIHDVILSFGFAVLMGFEFDLTAMAAFLTIIGYCINDTVVIYDRIRSNLSANLSSTVSDIVRLSVSQTIRRSIITSLVTLISIFGISFFSSVSIRNFSFIVTFGIVIGTYGSIFLASNLLLLFKIHKNKSSSNSEKDFMFYAS